MSTNLCNRFNTNKTFGAYLNFVIQRSLVQNVLAIVAMSAASHTHPTPPMPLKRHNTDNGAGMQRADDDDTPTTPPPPPPDPGPWEDIIDIITGR